MTDDKSPVEQAIDLLVYAPLGFALEARTLLPSFVERGRNQVTMAKMMGQFAVQQGQVEAGKRVKGAQDQAQALLEELGLVAKPKPKGVASPTNPTAPKPKVSQSGAGAADLAIAEYDSLAASQVIPRLPALSAAELEAVRAYEAEHRGRKTILTKISQLQSA